VKRRKVGYGPVFHRSGRTPTPGRKKQFRQLRFIAVFRQRPLQVCCREALQAPDSDARSPGLCCSSGQSDPAAGQGHIEDEVSLLFSAWTPVVEPRNLLHA
jgi:hypothetical protein